MERGLTYFKVDLVLSAHNAVGFTAENLEAYLKYRLKVNNKDLFNVLDMVELNVKRIGGSDGKICNEA